ncbi:MAG: hypothetical protein K7J46_08135 [Bryobacter sp.]|jgi:hypothetical protein|nr:hypothetical protein [Bryobacter sp. CoA8 C33]
MNWKRVLSLAAVGALTLGAAERRSLTIATPSLLNGMELKPGEYRLELAGERMVLQQGKQRVEAPVKLEAAEQRFPSTTILYQNAQGKPQIKEIRLGGTKHRLIFEESQGGL